VGIWLTDLKSLHQAASVVRLPAEPGPYLGVANLAGHVTSVFDLAVLLGEAPTERRALESSWLARLAKPSVALTFDDLERQVAVPTPVAELAKNAGSEVASGVHIAGVGTLRLLDAALLAGVLDAGSTQQSGEFE
jgi:chemotaxis signal transduction protein